MTRIPGFAACAAVLLAAACETERGEWMEPGGSRTVNSVRTEEVPLAQLVPAIPAAGVEQGRCDVSHRQPIGVGVVRMSWPTGPGEIRISSVMLDVSGALMSYSDLRQTAAGTTSVMIDVAAGTGGATNVTEGGTRLTIGRGTADEALRSAALGTPARRIERMLARCGRPGEKSGTS
jgi:hypothetical protein